ncbi:TrmB family transcriptional regulator [Providencia rustigianii]|uniref:TrmB family transcriptional regulator n=1 Tax=Providencia rustigianii TaxID=158850 RepID=UPI00223F0CAB|nr:TrmB family transcriptional regulator [Providencia rustigianii]
MLKQSDMTEKARLVFKAVTDEPATVGEIAWLSNLTDSCCRFMLPINTDPVSDGGFFAFWCIKNEVIKRTDRAAKR